MWEVLVIGALSALLVIVVWKPGDRWCQRTFRMRGLPRRA
jgi:hypothetical protein